MDKPINNENQAKPIGDDWAAFSSRPAGAAKTPEPGTQESGPQETVRQAAPAQDMEAAQTALQQELLDAQAQLAEASERLRRLEEQAKSQGIDTVHRPYAFATGQTLGAPAVHDEAESRDEAMTAQTACPSRQTAAESDNSTRLFGEDASKGGAAVAQDEEAKAKKGAAGVAHNALFRGLASAGPLVVALLLALLVWMTAYLGDLVTPDEVLTLQTISGMDSFAVLPHTADKALLPVYAWFAHLTGLIPLPCMDRLYGPVTSYLGALVCLFGLGVFSGFLRLGKNVTFAACLMLLGLPVFIYLSNCIGPVAFSCGLSLLAMGLICRAYMASFDMIGLVLGALLAAMAALSGGIYYGLVPMLGGLLFALWRGGHRLRNTDSVVGVVLFVVMLLVWYAAILLGTDVDSSTAFTAFLAVNGVQSITDGIVDALFAFVPFVAIVISVSWPKAIAHAASGLKASRQESALAYPWIALVLAIVLLVLSANRADFMLAVCIMAVLGAHSLMKLGTMGVKFFNILVCLALVVTSVLALGFTLPFVGDLISPFVETIVTTLPTHLLLEFAYDFKNDVMNDVRGMNFVVTIVLPLLPLLAAAIILHVAWRSNTAAAPLLVTIVSFVVLAQVFVFAFQPYMADQPAFRLTATSSVYVPEARALPFGAPATLNEEAAPAEEGSPAEGTKEPEGYEPAPEAAPEAAPAENAAGEAGIEVPTVPEEAANEGTETEPEESAPAEASSEASSEAPAEVSAEAPGNDASQDDTGDENASAEASSDDAMQETTMQDTTMQDDASEVSPDAVARPHEDTAE